MEDDGKKWFEALRRFVSECRQRRPIPARESLSNEEEMQCRIIGGSLIAWIEEHSTRFLEERAALAKIESWEASPFIVFTTDDAGLVASREILADGLDALTYLREDEFNDWRERHPDSTYRWHIHTWSYFAPLDQESAEKAQKYPLGAGESYWLHKQGTICGSLFGRGGAHLWKWNGEEPVLLEEGFDQWVS